MKESGKKIIAWVTIVSFGSFIVWAILNMLTHILDTNEAVENIKKAETFTEIIEVYDDYVSDFLNEKKVTDEFDTVSSKYLENNKDNLSTIFFPYNTLEGSYKINPDYNAVVLYIKDIENIYLFPNNLIWKVDENKSLIFNELYYNFEKNNVILENIPNVNSYKYSFDYSSVSKGYAYSEGYKKLDKICYYLNSTYDGNRICLEVDKYKNISIEDIKGTLFSYDGYTNKHRYVNTLKMYDSMKKINSQINISTPLIRINNSAILFTYNIGNDKELANKFFKEYQYNLSECYTISTKNDMVYVYADDDIIACIKCGQEDWGCFMMLSFNYSDIIKITNSNSTSNYKANSYKSSSGCGYKYSNGSTCGASVGSHSPLCDYHFNKLDSTYKYYTGY